MAPFVNVRLCVLGSPYGTCHRTRGHRGPHATFIGDKAFWFAWIGKGRSGADALGYGYFLHGRFSAMLAPKKGAA